jgi:hypothetical protein
MVDRVTIWGRSLLAGFAMSLAFAASASTLGASQLPYESAAFQARKFGIKMSYDVALAVIERSSAHTLGLSPPDGVAGQQVVGDGLVEAQLTSRVLGRDSTTHTLLWPATGAAVQRVVRRDRITKTSVKATQFARDGVRTLRTRTDSGSVGEIDWGSVRSSLRSYPPSVPQGRGLSDPTGLFFWLSGDQLEALGDSFRVPVFTDDQFVLMVMTVVESTSVDARFTERSGSSETLVEENRPALRVEITAQRLVPEKGDEAPNIDVLGLRGAITVLVDQAHRVPLRISGRAGRLGRVHFVLRKVVLPGSSSAP